jgi:hypothetical protein
MRRTIDVNNNVMGGMGKSGLWRSFASISKATSADAFA